MDVTLALIFEASMWIVAIIALGRSQLRTGAVGVGLILAYAANLWLIHWPAAAIYVLPWYSNLDVTTVESGFRQATYSIVSFTIGVLLLGPSLAKRLSNYRYGSAASRANLPTRVAFWYIGLGFVTLTVIQSFLSQIPSVSAVVSNGLNLIVVGVALACREAWLNRRHLAFIGWIIFVVCLPLLTILSQGFAGSGVAAALTVLAFVAAFYRPSRHVLIAALLISFLALSFYESYIRDRDVIRAVVWGGEGVSARLDQVTHTAAEIDWFDPTNVSQLRRIDDRLNQNYLVGSAVQYLDEGLGEWANGDTLVEAALAVVPRAIWPSKPAVAGSGSLVSRFTGITFADSTSVGIGHVMELYVNFGSVGVVIGFILLGSILGAIDLTAARKLAASDWAGFTLWFVPGLGMLQVGGSSVELVGSVAAGAVAAIVASRLLISRHVGRVDHNPGIVIPLPIRPHMRVRVTSAGH